MPVHRSMPNSTGQDGLDAEKAAASHALQSDNQDLREEQFAHKVRIDEGELEVLRRRKTTG